MTIEQVKAEIRNVPDFPKKGIQFKDITTVLKEPQMLKWLKDEVVRLYRDKGITKVVGLESRGFILGPAIAMDLGAGFVPERKPGKLPAECISVSYDKEYGSDRMEIHKDALSADDIVLIHDDLLATGGTAAGSVELVKKLGVKKVYVNCLIELDELKGREVFDKDIEVSTLLHFDK